MTVTRVISSFESDLSFAWRCYERDLWSISRDGHGNPVFPELDVDVLKMLNSALCRLGAAVAAARKREVRMHLFNAFCDLYDQNFDITPTLIVHSVERILGRGVDRKFIKTFATPGRTAADKSKVSVESLSDFEQCLRKKIADLSPFFEEKKEFYRHKWLASPEREAILSDWSSQSKQRSIYKF